MTRLPLDVRDDRFLELLLGRPRREVLADDERAAIAGERVLITGAGGSVGSALAKKIAAGSPACLALLDSSEYALFRVELELRERWPDVRILPMLVDVTRASVVRRAVAAADPVVMYHAAACKHVSMMERDVLSALRVNVLGSVNVARAAFARGARLVLVSSDKAANARSVMGASKRFAELAVLSEARALDRVAVVRFGNILGSSGSVLELMVDRLRRGRPLQVTDPEATRYFMTPAEAVALVVLAGRLGRTGEILWLDMGEPIRIVDLARRLLALAASAGLATVPIEFIGLRPGEKLKEELTVQGLELVPTEVPRIWIARQPPFDRLFVREAVASTARILAAGDAASALDLLQAAVPEYEPSALAREAVSDQSCVRLEDRVYSLRRACRDSPLNASRRRVLSMPVGRAMPAVGKS